MNRQPSLHKYSMLAMRVKILASGSVFKLNLSTTSPLNADCKYYSTNYLLIIPNTLFVYVFTVDGDEMKRVLGLYIAFCFFY